MIYYPKNRDKQLDDKLFQNPTVEYRGIPFWSWNCKVTKELIDKQLTCFQEMGFGGVDIHPRIGLDTEYLSEEYFELIQYTVDRCKEMGLLCWLYDDDRYPSGVAAGFVTEDRRYAARGLLLTENTQMLPGYARDREEFASMLDAGEPVEGYFATAYKLEMLDGYVKGYHRLYSAQEVEDTVAAGERVRLAYVKLAAAENRFQGNPYVDTMNPEATQKFLEITHEKYLDVVGADFGKAVPAMFTDEPRISSAGKMEVVSGNTAGDIVIPYSESFAEQMMVRFQVDPLDIVPDFIWNRLDPEGERNRYIYRETLAECFASAYMDELGKWCQAHDIALTGHVLSEESLLGQTRIVGDCMRCYRSMELPGIDVLIDNREYSTVKQVASVARQYGREGAVSELYGVTHWDCSFKTYKLQGDWQAALGITVRIPHLSWMSMEGEAKRDWPASISYQSPWYGQWPYLEDYFARLNTVLTRGKAICHIGVIHPVESMWLLQGPNDQTLEAQLELDDRFAKMNEWLLFGTQDFDYISEALLPDHYEIIQEADQVKLRVGQMEYTTILVPFLKTIRSTTLQCLERFTKQGGKVIFMGEVPGKVDALVSEKPQELAAGSKCIPETESDLLEALETERELEIRKPDGSKADNLIYQMRQDGNCRWLFMCHVNPVPQHDLSLEQYKCCVRGYYKLTVYHTMNGEISEMNATYQNGWTTFFWNGYAQDSLLLKMEACQPQQTCQPAWPVISKYQVVSQLMQIKEYTLQEPNVLLLDYAQYRLNDGPMHEKEEILRIDDHVREELGYMLRKEDVFQPWAMPEKETHKLTLIYEVESTISCPIKLAMERPEKCKIFWNDKEVEFVSEGYYVDEAILVSKLPDVQIGINKLVIEIAFDQKSNPENIYLLGEFGVRLDHNKAVLTKPCETLSLGDITTQGMPFYTGNLDYHFRFDIPEEKEYFVHIPHYKAPLLGFYVDGNMKELIAYAPHRVSLGVLKSGEHELNIRLYGNRFNGFGTLHNANQEFTWWGPGSYRVTGDNWTDSYMIRPVGIMDAPLIECKTV